MACHQSKNQVAKLRFLWPYELALSAGFELGNHRVEDHRLTPPLSLGLHQHVAHCPRSLTATPHDLSSGSRIQPQDQLGGGGGGFWAPPNTPKYCRVASLCAVGEVILDDNV